MICLVGQIAMYGVDTQVKLGLLRLALFWHFLDIFWIAFSFRGLSRGADMTDQTRDDGNAASRKLEDEREFHSYVWGLALALVLTPMPFALVHWAAMSALLLQSLIGAIALVQMVAHFRFFLHIGYGRSAKTCSRSRSRRCFRSSWWPVRSGSWPAWLCV
jgi:heme/copper-type cytochrome/quinol oxidase subunit 4